MAAESLPLQRWLTPAHSGMWGEQGLVDAAPLEVLRGWQGHMLEPWGPQIALPSVLVQGTYLSTSWRHASTSSPLRFSSQVTCYLPLSWQEAACRITNTDLASRLAPPPPAPSHFRAQLQFHQKHPKVGTKRFTKALGFSCLLAFSSFFLGTVGDAFLALHPLP